MIMKKLDWFFGNASLLGRWTTTRSTFLPRHLSDHSAMVIRLDPSQVKGKSAFKFLNLWVEHKDFQPLVSSVWQRPISGNPIYRLTYKLLILKQALGTKHRRFTQHISHKIARIKNLWEDPQMDLDANPANIHKQEAERKLAALYTNLCRDEEAFLK